ncbi:hypothetical protein ACM7EA_25400 [Pseudomonas aeruginosa]|uniref:hypothetical protein n=1 Tax=Pseudomonas aeruginosa TaxID=287 RepID=UPI0013CE38AF|nr:hypothetical protein [Pseudomonas aeruginosa]MBG5873032.1 hypothetical protein [Pseudomonas aeruginosa]MCT5734049.1 hypothetical protein [Pseudomonas aeruginosa]MCT5924337.1 hypothetical protein [Pseudomonas aeruginosa]HBO1698952.1 hypothetical protein [Pseudomonas aeruginosa]
MTDFKVGQVWQSGSLRREIVEVRMYSRPVPEIAWRRPGNEMSTHICSLAAFRAWRNKAHLVIA